MKKVSVIKKIFVLLAVLLIGMAVAACDDKADSPANPINPGPGDPGPDPGISYTKVSATSSDELMDFLGSESNNYEISLNMTGKDIYLQKNVTISKSMKIVSSPNNIYTIHSINEKNGVNFYCLNLLGDVELQFCEFIGYDITSASAGGISAGSPPIMIKAGNTLTVGKDAALILNPSVLGYYTATYTGGAVAVQEGGSFRNETYTMDTVFNTGITGLTVYKGGAAELVQSLINIGGTDPTFEIESGSFGLERNKDVVTFFVDGNTSLRKDWDLGNYQSLHIKSGEMEVRSGVLIKILVGFAGIILDGNIRLNDNSRVWVWTNDPFPRMSGDGAIIIEPTRNLPVISLLNPGPPEGWENLGLKPKSNARVEIGAFGFRVTRINAAAPATAEIVDAVHYAANKLTTIIDSGVTVDVKNEVNVIDGGILDVRGTVNVDSGGQINIGKFFGPTNGSIRISGTVTVDNGGIFTDTSAEYINIFTYPAFDGGGSLIIKSSGNAIMGTSPEVIVGATGILKLDSGATLEIGKRSTYPTFKLTGGAELTVSSGMKLAGEFALSPNTNTVITELTVTGGQKLIIDSPYSLIGPSGSIATAYRPTIVLDGAGTQIQMFKPDKVEKYFDILYNASPPPSNTFIWSPPNYWVAIP